MKQHLSMEECKLLLLLIVHLTLHQQRYRPSNKYLPLQDNNGIYSPTTRNEINRFDRLHQTMKSVHSKHA